jgi:YesN/AraC family two-component response regulator
MLKIIITGLKRICDTVKEDRTEHRQVLYSQIVEFIEKQYYDSNLSLTMLADHFHLTPPYLSAFFKKQNGVNLSEYIALYRIEVAKSLLVQTDMTIGEISRKVGYTNHIGFGRVFKKWQGITPGQYRETNQMLISVSQD